MKRISKTLIVISFLALVTGCNSDIVITTRLKGLKPKCIYIEPLKTENPHIGEVLRDVIQKEFMKKRFDFCEEKFATIIISGSAFLTNRSQSSDMLLLSSAAASQSVESVSLVIKDRKGNLLGSASFDNNESLSASKIGMEFGKAIADKLR